MGLQQCATTMAVVTYVSNQQEEANDASVSVNEKDQDLSGERLCNLVVHKRERV